MTIKIKKINGGYTATVTPPHGTDRHWLTDKPMDCDELIKSLIALGCHQTDIGDALYETDPNWQEGSAQ